MQPLAQFQIELVDDADDRAWGTRAQRLLDRPKGVVAARGFDQNQAFRIEPERGQTMAVKAAMVVKAVTGEDEDELFGSPWWGRGEDVRKQCRDKAKRSGGGVRLGDDFMQRAAGESAIGKASIQRGQPERERLVNICRAGQQAT